MLLIAARVASIALFQPRDCLSGRHDRLVGMGRIGGAGKLLAAKYTSRENEESKVCLYHNIFSFTYVWNDWIVWKGGTITSKISSRELGDGKTRALILYRD
jgi:hypothetical protein